MIHVGIVGKPNCGKSTFFSASTLVDVDIANYPFTTINPNIGITYTRAKCPCKELNLTCNPNNSKCINGTRLIPVKILDVAGLVPDAHKGKGLGNKFLDDLRQASVLIHIVDISGKTDAVGKPTDFHNPAEDIQFLINEIDHWLLAIVKKQLDKFVRRVQYQHEDFYKFAAEALSGLGFTEQQVYEASRGLDTSKPLDWSEEQIFGFVSKLRSMGKPILIAANKSDTPLPRRTSKPSKSNFRIRL